MVGKICTVCKSCSFIDKHLSYFTYPADRRRRYEWLEAVGRMDLLGKLDNNKTRSNHRICESHFEDKYIKRSTVVEGRKFLSKDAFPTLYLDSPTFNPTSDIPNQSYNNMLLRKRESQSQPMPYDEPDSDDDSSNSLMYTDMSEFCESVIKVSKSTQTHDNMKKSRTTLYNDPDTNVKKRKKEDDRNVPFIQSCNNLLSGGMTQLIQWHLDAKNGLESENYVLFALNLYYSGVNTYNILKNVLSLPSYDSLKRFLVPKTTKLDKINLNVLKCKVNNMSAKERICSISVGSTFLKSNLYYDIRFDRIIGLHDIDGEQSLEPAKYAIVLMAEGIIENWRQPIAYAFIHDYDNFPEISQWINEVISLLIDIGLDVRSFVSDPKSEFLYTSETRYVTPERSYFSLNNRNIFYFYDTSQLLAVVKNNMKSCNFQCNGTNKNVEHNLDILKKLYELCNLLNTKSHSDSQFNKGFSNKKYEISFLNHMISLFQNLKIVRKIDGMDVTENMKFIDSFLITLKSVILLYQDLTFIGVKYLITSRLTHKSLKSFFRRVRQFFGREEYTAKQFNTCFVRNYVSNMLKRPLGPRSCNYQYSIQMEHLSQEILNNAQSLQETNILNKPLAVGVSDYRRDLPEKNAFVYVCGYLYLKCLHQHCCDKLKAYLKYFKESNDTSEHYRCCVSLGTNIKNRHILPPDTFTEFLMVLENKFKNFFKSAAQISSLGREVLKELESCEFEMPCPCFPIDYLKVLFVRVRLFYTIRENNRRFRRKKGSKTFSVFSL